MSLKGLAAMFMALFVIANTGAAFASPPASGKTDTAETGNLGEALTVLHAVGQWSIDAQQDGRREGKVGSREELCPRRWRLRMRRRTPSSWRSPRKMGSRWQPLDPKTEEGKSLLDRMKAETLLLSSLKGDAFDKEYMTLVTNTQQSVSHFLEAHKAAAKDPAVKQFMGDMRLHRPETSQDGPGHPGKGVRR